MWNEKKTLRQKIICLNEVHNFLSGHFSTGCIFYVFILKKHYWISRIPLFNQNMGDRALIINILKFMKIFIISTPY